MESFAFITGMVYVFLLYLHCSHHHLYLLGLNIINLNINIHIVPPAWIYRWVNNFLLKEGGIWKPLPRDFIGICRYSWPSTFLSWSGVLAVASFTKEVNPILAKRPLVFNGRLANRGLISLVKESTVSFGIKNRCVLNGKEWFIVWMFFGV